MWRGPSFVMLPSYVAADSMDPYLRGRYLPAVERVTDSGSFFAGIGNPRGGMIVRSRTHE